MITTHISRLALVSVVGAVLAAAAITPAAASAATQRYASPSGSGTACSSATPCAISQAITAASLGDQVIVKPGNYPLTTTLQTPTQVTVRGVAGQPRPRLQFGGAAQFGLRLTGGSTLRYVEVDQSGSAPALVTGAAAINQVIARGTNTGVETAEIQNSTIRNSLVVASGADATALITGTNGATNTSTYRNVTAIATGSGSVAINAEALGANGNATINLANVIAWAGPAATASLEVSTDWSGAHAMINTTHSSYGTEDYNGSNTQILSDGSDLGHAPLFANAAAGNYHEATGSPTINAGANDPLNGTLDVDGDPRTIATTDIGADEFVLLPTAATGPANTIAAHSATLTGTVNPKGAPTSYRFQYGTSTSYTTTTTAINAGAGTTTITAATPIIALNPSTTYHYRIKATNSAGAAYGTDHTFTTTP